MQIVPRGCVRSSYAIFSAYNYSDPMPLMVHLIKNTMHIQKRIKMLLHRLARTLLLSDVVYIIIIIHVTFSRVSQCV